MTQREFQEYKECALDAFAKAVIRNTGVSLYRKEASEARHRISMHSYRDMSTDYDYLTTKSDHAEDLDSLKSRNTDTVFHVHNYRIHVSNADLARTLHLLKPKLREVILLSSFTEMTDREIAAILHIPKSTLHDRKKAALRRLHIHLTGKEVNHG